MKPLAFSRNLGYFLTGSKGNVSEVTLNLQAFSDRFPHGHR